MAEEASEMAIAEVMEKVAEAPSEAVSAKPEDAAEGKAEEEEKDDARPETDEEVYAGPKEISAEAHEENIIAMGEFLQSFIPLAAEGKLPVRKAEKTEFEMKKKVDSTEDLLEPPEEDLEEEVKQDEFVSPEGSVEERAEEEEEEAETASMQEAYARRQQRLEEFDAVHDEAQRLRIMNLLLQSRVLKSMQRRPKRGAAASTASAGPTGSAASAASAGSRSGTAPTSAGDLAAVAETLEKELLEAGEVRRQLDAELHRSAMEEELRQRLSTARQKVAERAVQLQQLQEKLVSRMRAPPGRRQDAERMLKRVWPQLLRLRKERLLHTRAKHDLESAKQQVAELEVFGHQRTVTTYEELLGDGVKLAEHVQERTEQLLALRNIADRDLQQAAHLREEFQGAQYSILEARRNDALASIFLQRARREVLKTKKHRDELFKENTRLTRQMELLAKPELLRDHEEVRRRLRMAQAELEKLRVAYISQERRIATARKLLHAREQSLQGDVQESSSDQSFFLRYLDAKCGPSKLHADFDS